MKIHGYWRTPTYRSWEKMIQRCTNRNRKDYRWYGARGIKVCRRWRHSFRAFLNDMGECPPGLTLDRIDPEKGYEPGNCRWATWEQQRESKRPAYTLTEIESLVRTMNFA